MEQELNTEEKIESTEEEANNEKPAVKEVDLQAKIDSAVKTRLARERETQKAREQQWEEEKAQMQEELEYLKKQFQAQIDEQLSDIPASYRSLVSKLSVREQVEWLAEQKKEQKDKPKPPVMPNFNKKENIDGKPEVQHMKIDKFL